MTDPIKPNTPVLQVPKADLVRVVIRVALRGRNQITRRGFPAIGETRSAQGKLAKPLSDSYARYKRRKGREPISNQRLSSKTAQALKIVRLNVGGVNNDAVLGFSSRRVIAESLQKRNLFMGHTAKEQKILLGVAQKELAGHAAAITVKHGKIIIQVG